MEAISVLVVDDHALFAEALRAQLSREPDLAPVWVAYTMHQVRTHLAAHRTSVILLDVVLDDGSGVDLLDHIRMVSPHSRVVMLTGVESVDLVVTALRRGARAWLPKTTGVDHLVRVIRGVHQGEVWLEPALLGKVTTALLASDAAPDPLAALTVREREVLQCMVDGLHRSEIAARLHISANTVRTHTQNLLAKLGAHSTLECVAIALRHGMSVSGF